VNNAGPFGLGNLTEGDDVASFDFQLPAMPRAIPLEVASL